MNPSDPVVGVMRRTLHNLEFIERHAASEGPYEVTKLVNHISRMAPNLLGGDSLCHVSML